MTWQDRHRRRPLRRWNAQRHAFAGD